MKYRYVDAPHPCILIDEIVSPATYATMRFPDEQVRDDASWGITATDAAYADVMQQPTWRALHEELCGVEFVTAVLELFAEDLRRERCAVDPARAGLVDFVESRGEKEQARLAECGDPNEIYTRLDFQSKAEGAYREFVHLDWPRRLVGGILFFSDAQEEGLEGGELALYRDKAFRDDRWCHEPELLAMFPPRHNTGVIFLNSNRGFHGPRAIRRLTGRRRWLYYTISSKVDVWPASA